MFPKPSLVIWDSEALDQKNWKYAIVKIKKNKK